MACLSLTLNKKTLKPSKKKASIPNMDEKKLHACKFQLKSIGENMRCKLLEKQSTGKTTECSKHQMHFSNNSKVY